MSSASTEVHRNRQAKTLDRFGNHHYVPPPCILIKVQDGKTYGLAFKHRVYTHYEWFPVCTMTTQASTDDIIRYRGKLPIATLTRLGIFKSSRRPGNSSLKNATFSAFVEALSTSIVPSQTHHRLPKRRIHSSTEPNIGWQLE